MTIIVCRDKTMYMDSMASLFRGSEPEGIEHLHLIKIKQIESAGLHYRYKDNLHRLLIVGMVGFMDDAKKMLGKLDLLFPNKDTPMLPGKFSVNGELDKFVYQDSYNLVFMLDNGQFIVVSDDNGGAVVSEPMDHFIGGNGTEPFKFLSRIFNYEWNELPEDLFIKLLTFMVGSGVKGVGGSLTKSKWSGEGITPKIISKPCVLSDADKEQLLNAYRSALYKRNNIKEDSVDAEEPKLSQKLKKERKKKGIKQ